MNRLRTAAHRAPIFLGIGSVLATGAVAPGCRSDPPPSTQADLLPEKGVRTRISEVAAGSYVIDEEVLVDTATHVVVRRLDGTEERITDPDRFSALLVSPDSARMLAALMPAPRDTAGTRPYVAPGTSAAPAPGGTASGGGDSWDGDPGTSGPNTGNGSGEVRHHSGGFPLGHLLFFSLAMNAWRPNAYRGVYGSPPSAAYRNDAVRRGSGSAGSGLLAAQRSGRAPTGYDDARTRSVARTRGVRPSGGRSGFGSSWGRSGG